MECERFSFSRNDIKWIAFVLMLVDHMSAAFLPETSNIYQLLRFTIGRVSYPLFLVVFIEGFFYTKNRKKHLRDLLLFGLISEPVFDFAIFGKWVYWGHQNVLLSFFLCFLMLCCFEKVDEKEYKSSVDKIFFNVFIYFGFCILAYLTKVDYDLINCELHTRDFSRELNELLH